MACTFLYLHTLHTDIYYIRAGDSSYNIYNNYMPSKFCIVKLPLALDNIFDLTEFIMVQPHDDAKNHIGASIWIFGTAL